MPSATRHAAPATRLDVWIDTFAAARAVPVRARDRSFVRALAGALHAASPAVRLEEADALGLTDVVATFRLAARGVSGPAVQLVVTGRREQSAVDVTLRWAERDFPRVLLRARAGDVSDVGDVADNDADASAPLWASLDHGPRGESAWLLRDVEGLLAGSRVEVIAVASLGERRELRVRTVDGPRTLPLDAVTWTDAP